MEICQYFCCCFLGKKKGKKTFLGMERGKGKQPAQPLPLPIPPPHVTDVTPHNKQNGINMILWARIFDDTAHVLSFAEFLCNCIHHPLGFILLWNMGACDVLFFILNTTTDPSTGDTKCCTNRTPGRACRECPNFHHSPIQSSAYWEKEKYQESNQRKLVRTFVIRNSTWKEVK